MTNSSKLHDLVDEFKEAGVFEDRREYDVEELLLSNPGLTRQEAENLHWLIQKEFTEGRPDWKDISADTIKEYVEESEHGGFDGWDNEHDRIVLERYLWDMRLYAKHSGR